MSLVDQMGQSILAKASKRREKEERNQLIGAAGNLATSIINTRLQESAEKFLESEDYLKAQAKQASAYNIAQSNRKTYEESMAYEGGQKGYASDKIYAKLLTDFNEAYPEEDYDETQRKGYLRKLADERSQSYVDSINSNFETAIKIRSPEDFEKYYAENAPGTRTAGEWLNNKVGGFFNLKSTEDVRAERLEALMTSSENNREAVFEAKKALGAKAKLPEVAKLAEEIKSFKITTEDYEELSRKEDNLEVQFPDGTERKVRAHLVTYAHPNIPGKTIQKYEAVRADSSSVAAFEKGEFGTFTEVVEYETPAGRKGTKTITFKLTTLPTGERAKLKVGEPVLSIDPDSVADFSQNLTDPQRKSARSTFESISSSVMIQGVGKGDVSMADSQLIESVLSKGEGFAEVVGAEDAYQSRITIPVAAHARHLQTVGLGDKNLNSSEAELLASAMMYRHFNSMVKKDDDVYFGRGTIEASEIEPSINNGLNSTTVSQAASVYAVDAYYALENSKSSQKIYMENSTLAALKMQSIVDFQKLIPEMRLKFIEGYEAYGPASPINSDPLEFISGRSYVERLKQVHKDRLKKGK